MEETELLQLLTDLEGIAEFLSRHSLPVSSSTVKKASLLIRELIIQSLNS